MAHMGYTQENTVTPPHTHILIDSYRHTLTHRCTWGDRYTLILTGAQTHRQEQITYIDSHKHTE